MANLIPVPENTPVPQIETNTRVLAGPGGPANKQAQALLNRQAFLEERTDRAILSFPDLASAEVAAANLPDGQRVDVLSEQKHFTVVGHALELVGNFLRKDLAEGGAPLGFMPSGIGAEPTTIHEALDIFIQKPTGHFYSEDGSKINRVADRLFVGDAIKDNGEFLTGGGSWLSGSPQPNLGWMVRDAQFASLSTHGMIGVFGGSRSSDQSKLSGHASPAAIGVAGMGYADRADIGAWGGYFDAKRVYGAQAAFAVELEVADLGTDGIAINPTSSFGSLGLFQVTGGAWIGAGADPNVNPITYDCTVGVALLNNGARFKTGFLIRSDCLAWLGGEKQAFYMGQNNAILWDADSGGVAARIRSDVTSSGSKQELFFLNNQTRLYSAGEHAFTIDATSGAANRIDLKTGGPGQPVQVIAAGFNDNIDLVLSPKGSGLIRLNVPHATGTLTPSGYIQIVDSGGFVRRLLVG